MKAHLSFTSMVLALLFAFAAAGRLHAQEDELDWGDAPDQPYPTLNINSGANHAIIPGMHLGNTVDGEPDGQPDLNALGDDIDVTFPPPNDDEDGVVFTSLLMPGLPATVTVTASQPGVLDAWIDFNRNGSWGDPLDVVFASVPLNPGANPLNFVVPAGSPTGQTYARFRFSSAGGLPPHGPAQDGEVEDYEVWLEAEQGDPHKMHWPQYPDPDGWDVRACNGPDGLQKVLADDFLCTSSGWITNITFWGSWFNDEFEIEHLSQGITNIHLSLHSDIPDPDGDGPEYSRPGELLWEWDLDPTQVPPEFFSITEEPESLQGWYDPNVPLVEPQNHVRYFRYEVGLLAGESIYQTNGTIYWLDISVETLEGMWGWKTSRSPHFNDDAVWTDMPVQDPLQWNELRDPIYSNSLDLAFIIDGEEGEPGNDWGDLPDTYNTLAANNGANHTIVQGFILGSLIDAEIDGQPTAAADGDDLNNQPDEDGVTFNTSFIPGQTAQFDVWASAPGQLDIWMDLDRNGAWTLPNEHIFSGGIGGGLNPLSFLVPVGSLPGQNVLRYRFTSSPSAYPGGAPVPTGSASDGEVEDYYIVVASLDWGDAPDPTYPTLAASGGPNHMIVGGGPKLGTMIDNDPDGQPDPTATGDDLANLADEDGVSFLSPLVPGTMAQISVTADTVLFPGPAPAYLQGWVDFNADGDWLDAGEQIFTDVVFNPLPSTQTLSFPVPAGAVAGPTFARFRLSRLTGLAQTGFAQNGEVEDYVVDILEPQPVDWGDAPDTVQTPYYPTLLVNNGAHHLVGSLFMGVQVDAEPDGQPTTNADGDDINLSDDEEGVTLTSLLMPGGHATVEVVASQAGVLDAWIDFSNDGSWGQPGDRVFNGQSLVSGTNSLTFPVPMSAAQGHPAYSRFRISSAGAPTYTGLALDGEVEDHEFIIQTIEGGTDWGDAPNIYPTLNASSGASHGILAGVMLGAIVDNEPDGQPSVGADGDDTDSIYTSLGDDEDGVVFTSKLVAGTNATVNVVVGVSGGQLDAWVDFGADGTWSAGDQIFTSLPVGPGINSLSFPVPTPPAALGPTYARFRISTAGGLGPFGPANDGEVEDYVVDLVQPAPSPALEITNLYFTVSNTIAWVEWNSQTDIVYQVQSSTNLTTNVWVDIGTTLIGPVYWQTNSTGPDVQFYRVLAPWTE